MNFSYKIKILEKIYRKYKALTSLHSLAESEEELKILQMKVKEESKKAGLNLNIQKTKVMAFSPITSWQIVGEQMETDRFSWAPKSL